MISVVEEGVFRTFDGTELFFQMWPATRPKALIIGVHGLGEHVGAYGFLAEALGLHQYQLVMFDHRGHGKSEGNRGVGSVDDYVLDLKMFVQVMKSSYPQTPFYFLAHSMGGLILAKYLVRNGLSGARGAIFSSPLLGVAVEVPGWKLKSARFLSKTFPDMTLDNEIPHKNLTHDYDVVQFYDRDHLRHNRISSRLYISILESIDFVFKNSEKMPSQVLFQVAGDDLVVSLVETDRFFKQIPGKSKLIIHYEKYYHEIYNELGRQTAFKDLIDWLNMNEKKS